jgi:Fe-S-cluster containining protein
MKDKKKKKTGYSNPLRLPFSEETKSHPWLSMLLDAYYVIDKGVSEAIKIETQRHRKVACTRGCSICCKTQRDIPVYPLELVGLSWYVTEKINGPVREIIKKQLKEYKENDPCPFLIEDACSIHPMRPISCRQFIVFGKPCADGEDPYYTRREDVLSPIKKYVDKAFFIMLPFYGVEKASERMKIVEKGSMHTMVKLIQTCNWKSLADKMEEFERVSL